MNLRKPRRSSFAEPITKTLDWDVVVRPITVDGSVLDNYQSLVRNDNGTVLSVTKKSYQPASNKKFKEIVSKIHEFTGFNVEGYSVFQEGRKVLAFLKNNEMMKIGDFDTQNYMVIGNSFDCSTGFFTGVSNVVLRCTNQFSRVSLGHNIRHNKQLNGKLDELVLFYKDYMHQEHQLRETFYRWNRVKVDKNVVRELVNQVLDISSSNMSTMKTNQQLTLLHSIDTEMRAMGNTGYGLFNGLTHYSTHEVRCSGKTFGNVLGHPFRLNEKGYKFINSLIN